MGCLLPSSFFCNNTAPTANPDASTSSLNGLSSSGCASTGLLMTLFHSSSNAFWHCSVHIHSTSFLVNSLSGRAIWANPRINGR
jgi:hypothetical protein